MKLPHSPMAFQPTVEEQHEGRHGSKQIPARSRHVRTRSKEKHSNEPDSEKQIFLAAGGHFFDRSQNPGGTCAKEDDEQEFFGEGDRKSTRLNSSHQII